MRQVWLQVFTTMICGSIVKFALPNMYLWVIVDLIVFGIAYMILRRYPYIDFKKSMLFIGGLTVINLLVDIRIINDMVGNIASLVIVGWVMFGGLGKGLPSIRHKWHK